MESGDEEASCLLEVAKGSSRLSVTCLARQPLDKFSLARYFKSSIAFTTYLFLEAKKFEGSSSSIMVGSFLLLNGVPRVKRTSLSKLDLASF
jgi:hypothetical protein